MGEAEVKITQSFDHRRLNSSIHQVHYDERLRQSIITNRQFTILSVSLLRNIIISFFSDYKKVKMMKMMMILRRRLREIGKIENERDKGMDLF